MYIHRPYFFLKTTAVFDFMTPKLLYEKNTMYVDHSTWACV
jgi:hypothetical protein